MSLRMNQLLSVFTATLLVSGCASIGKQWKNLISGDSKPEQSTSSKPRGATFSQQNNLAPLNYRKYKRTNRKSFEDNAHLESKAGSLWVMEGQGAYLFSQNVVRMIGDPLAVRIEGESSEQLSSKTKVISTLLTQLEERRRRALGRGPTSEKTADTKDAANASVEENTAQNPQTPAQPNLNPQQNPVPEEESFAVKTVPTRVVERTVDGNYRVRGTQPFMIGQREYKVIVSGIVRAEDFNEDGISASQLLDANYDIVSAKSSEMR